MHPREGKWHSWVPTYGDGADGTPGGAGGRGRRPASLARDDLVGVRRAVHRAHHDRLDVAARAQRGGWPGELGLGVIAARIARIWPEALDRHATLIASLLDRLGFLADIAHERGKAAPKSRSPGLICHVGVSRICHRAASRDLLRRERGDPGARTPHLPPPPLLPPNDIRPRPRRGFTLPPLLIVNQKPAFP